MLRDARNLSTNHARVIQSGQTMRIRRYEFKRHHLEIPLPRPSKGVKFQPPGLFLVVKGLKFQTLGGFRYILNPAVIYEVAWST